MADDPVVEWRKLRADQLRDRARNNAIVIQPIASLEQHGPHLPVEVDSMLGETVAIRAARKVAERGQSALVLPVLWTGLSEHHMSFGVSSSVMVRSAFSFPPCAFSNTMRAKPCRSTDRHTPSTKDAKAPKSSVIVPPKLM